MTTPRIRHCNRQATQERLVVVMQRRASTGEILVWNERGLPVVAR